MKGYRIGLTIQELEARPGRAAEAKRRNSFLVYPTRKEYIRRSVARTEGQRLFIAMRNGASIGDAEFVYSKLLQVALDRLGYPADGVNARKAKP